MIDITLHYLIFLLIIFSNGFIFQKIFLNNSEISLNFFEQSILGLITTGFIALILNFFFPLNDFFVYLNLILGLIFIFYFKNKIKFNYNSNSIIFILVILFLSFINIYGSNFSDDLHHYHGGYITNTDNGNYIIGSNFLHHHYGYSSIWLILHSYLNFNSYFLQDIHVLNGLILFLVLSYFFTENNEKSRLPNQNLLLLISSIFIFFFLLKYTRLKEFGLDRPGVLIYCFLIFFSAKYQYILKEGSKAKDKLLLIILLFCLFITSIKIFFLSCFLLPLIFIFQTKSYSFLLSKLIFIFYFLSFCYFLKNILINGCLIYPFEFTCFSNLSWNSKEIASGILIGTEAMSKSFKEYNGSLNVLEYINNFNWVKTWSARNFEEFNNYLFTIILVIFLFFISNKSKKNLNKFNQIEIIIFSLFIINFLIFLKSPVFRFHHMLFIFFGVSVLILSKRLFVKKIFFYKIILVLLLTFNIGKNFQRIYQTNFYNNPYEHIKKINWYRPPVKKEIGSFVYYKGWIDAYPVGNMHLDKFKYKKKFWFDMIYK